MSQLEAHQAVVDAERVYHGAPTPQNWKAVESAKTELARLVTIERVQSELDANEAARASRETHAKKVARLAHLCEALAQFPADAESLAKRIGDALLPALPLILNEEQALVDASNSARDEAIQLRDELGAGPAIPYALQQRACSQSTSDYVRSKMPEGVDPLLLVAYAGKWW